MEPLKILLSFVLILWVCPYGLAQEDSVFEVGVSGSGIFAFVDNLNTAIDAFFEKEKAQRFNRKLGYLKSDVKTYIRKRKTLTRYLQVHHHNLKVGKTKKALKTLKKESYRLASKSHHLIPHINSNFYIDALYELEILQLEVVNAMELYAAELEKWLRNGYPDEAKINTCGAAVEVNLTALTKRINTLQNTIKIKYAIQD